MVALFVAPVAFVAAWLFDRRRRVYADLGTTPAAAVSAGRNEVKGRAWHRRPLRSHRGRLPCVWWTYRLEEERTHTRTVTITDNEGHSHTRTETYRQWHGIESLSHAHTSVDVVDDSGAVRVVFSGAAITSRLTVNETFREEDRRGFVDRLLSFDNRTGRYRETERAIAIGDELFVVGEASMRDDAATPQIDHGSPFVISTRSEESHRNRSGAAVPFFLIIGIALAVFGAAAIDHPAAVPLTVAAVTLLLLSAVAVAVFNRLQLLVQQAARAWSLIDIQILRRHDLIPRLAEVARAATAHEQVTIRAATNARAILRDPIPDRETVDEADAEVRDQTERITTLLATIEAYPELMAGTAVQRLQYELADTENRIAGARTFYNESVTLLRTRRGTFPGVFVARFADPRRFVLFGADGFEPTVPTITYEFDSEAA